MAFKYAKNGKLRKLNKVRKSFRRLSYKHAELLMRKDPFLERLRSLDQDAGTYITEEIKYEEKELSWEFYLK